MPAWYLPNGTNNADENELEGASESCERWSIWCGALVIISIIAELIIAIIEPSYGLFLKLSVVPDAGVAVGIVGEVVLGMWNNRIQTALRSRSNVKLADAINRAADANTRAAEANARVKEAEVEILRLGPRRIDIGKFAKALEGRPKEFVELIFLRGNVEAYSLALQIQQGLTAAKWEVSEPIPKTAEEMALCVPHPKAAIADAPPTGHIAVTRRVETPQDMFTFQARLHAAMAPGGYVDATNALIRAVGSLQGGGWTVGVFPVNPAELDAPAEGVLRVLIGPRS